MSCPGLTARWWQNWNLGSSPGLLPPCTASFWPPKPQKWRVLLSQGMSGQLPYFSETWSLLYKLSIVILTSERFLCLRSEISVDFLSFPTFAFAPQTGNYF